MRRPLIGATTLGFGDAAIDEVFRGLVAVGAECCELNARPGQHGGETLTAARVRPLVGATGVRVTSVGGYSDFAAEVDTEVDRLLDACRLASDLEVGLVRAMVADAGPGITREGIRAQVVDGLGRAGTGAERLGVHLAVENHGRLANDGPWLAEVVRDAGVPGTGFTMDTGNFAWAGHSPEQVAGDLSAVLPRTLSVHVKDVSWQAGEFAGFVPAGTGELDLPALFGELLASGFTGPVVSEYEGPGSHQEGTIRSIAFLRQLTQRLGQQ